MTINRFSIDLDRGTRRFQRNALRGGRKPEATPPVRPRGILDPELLRAAIPRGVPQARPARADPQPGHLRGRDHGCPRHDPHRPQHHRGRSRRGAGRSRVPGPDRPVAVVHRPVRDVRRGRRRGARSGPGLDPAQDALRVHRPPTASRRLARGRRLVRASQGRPHRRPRRATRSRATATSSRASGTSTRRPSPASPLRSSRSRAPTSGAR